MRSFKSSKSSENIHKKKGGSYYVVSANKGSSVTCNHPATKARGNILPFYVHPLIVINSEIVLNGNFQKPNRIICFLALLLDLESVYISSWNHEFLLLK